MSRPATKRTLRLRLAIALLVVAPAIIVLTACGDTATQSVAAGMGRNPVLPNPRSSLIPTVNVAVATGWPSGVTPRAAEGTRVNAFAGELNHPRWLYVLPNGDVLVAETNAPVRPDNNKGVKGWAMSVFMKTAGASVASANRITLLRDADGDGIAELRSPFLANLNSPFGMGLIGDELFIANTDAVLRFRYRAGDTQLTVPGVRLVSLPAGAINHHWTKNLIASVDGATLYVTVGSNSNVGEAGMAAETGRAAIWAVATKDGRHRIFASGLRNANGLAWEPRSGTLWTVVNERDELGSDLVPDYLTSVVDGGFYGWPYSYFGGHVDERVREPRPDLVATALVPDYALGPHTASLGLAHSVGNRLPSRFADGMFIGQHGSWNRQPHSGYKVIFVPFDQSLPADGDAIDVLSGFLGADNQAYGRPVGVVIDKRGALLVADDVGNVIWRVSAAQ